MTPLPPTPELRRTERSPAEWCGGTIFRRTDRAAPTGRKGRFLRHAVPKSDEFRNARIRLPHRSFYFGKRIFDFVLI